MSINSFFHLPLHLLIASFILSGCVEKKQNEIREPILPVEEVISVKLESKLKFDKNITEVWGYEQNGEQYALVGYSSGVHIVNTTDALNPVLTAKVSGIPGFDIKVWKNYMYTVIGHGNGDGAIVDLSDITKPKRVNSFPSAHNIFISEQGYLFLEAPGLRIMDLNENPLEPKLIWQGGISGHDATVVGNRLYDFHGSDGTNIYDISNISQPALLGSIQTPRIRYHHSGWPTSDENYLLICDEGALGANEDITVWDIKDPAQPKLVDSYTDSTSIVHNLYIVDKIAYVSYYNSGFKIFDVSNPESIRPIDNYDTNSSSGDNFGGAFGVYPFASSKYIYVSDSGEGLHIFSLVTQPGQSNAIFY